MGCAYLYEIMPRVVFPAVVAACLGALTGAAAAAGGIDWEIGAGAGTRPDYEGSEDYEAVPIGFLRATWDRNLFVELAGAHGSGGAPRLRANLVADDFLQAGPFVQYRLGRGDVENASVDALPNIDGTVELGAFFGFEEQGWEGAVSFAQDVGGEHKGFVAEATAGYTARLAEGLSLRMIVASNYASDGYMGTYFTVDSADAPAAGLASYDADDGFRDVGTRWALNWEFPGAENVGIAVAASYFRLLSDAADSPIVDDVGSKNQLFGGVMVTFHR